MDPFWRGEGAYLTKMFRSARQREEPVGGRNFVRQELTDLLLYANAKDLIQSRRN